MGGAERSGREMVTFTDEALKIMRLVLAGRVVQFQGTRHTIGRYSAGPVPPATVPIWLGSSGPRMLAVTGRSADGWISPLSTYVAPQQNRLELHAKSAGRGRALINGGTTKKQHEPRSSLQDCISSAFRGRILGQRKVCRQEIRLNIRKLS